VVYFMSRNLSREIKKIKVRLSEFSKEEEAFLEYMENCVRKFEELDHYLKLDSEERDFKRALAIASFVMNVCY
jgi:hypothetical protein